MGRRLGHHCYSSFGGYRTVHCSPWLARMSDLLDQRAQSCYSQTGRYDIVRGGGLWIASFVIANGTDHVGRPRSLVHQVIMEEQSAPPIFSPLFLRGACLDSLAHADPALEQRLVTDLDALNVRALMPAPDRFGSFLRGPARPVILSAYDALNNPGDPVVCELPHPDRIAEDLAPALACVMVHGQRFQFSTLDRLLPDPFGAAGPRVQLRSGVSGGGGHRSSTTILDLSLASPGHVLVEILERSQEPHKVLFLFRQLPVAELFQAPPLMSLLRLVLDGRLSLDQQGVPQFGLPGGRGLAALLCELGGLAVVRCGLERWAASQRAHLADPEQADELDQRIIACRSHDDIDALFLAGDPFGLPV